ncbi:MAG: penicillin-binding protein 2 [Candidatus Moraniibacteriota bacterium]
MKKKTSIKKSGVERNGVFSRCRRLGWLLFFMCLVIVGVVWRLFVLQVVQSSMYAKQAVDQQTASGELFPDRGEVFLQDEGKALYPLAINRPYFAASLAPKEVADPEAVAMLLSDTLQLNRQDTLTKINQKDDPYIFLAHKLPDDAVNKIRAAGLKGIHLDKENYRFYPAETMASQVIGFTGTESGQLMGRYGVEASWDDALRGQNGMIDQERDAAGRWIPLSSRETIPAQNGNGLVLTINRVIQYEATRILRESLDKYGSQSGSVVVLEPSTGRILAMVSLPEFDPNNYAGGDMASFVNPITSSVYEPGSIMKPLTMAMGLEAGKVTPLTEYVDTGHVFESGYDIRNAEEKIYGQSNMVKVLDQSINTGVVFVEKLLGNSLFSDFMDRFGFGAKTGIDLPAEAVGSLANLTNTKRSLSFFTASFGQGVSVTPLQMVMAYGALANGGELMKPQIVEAKIHPDGTREEIPPVSVRRVIRSDTAQTIGTMLRDVVVNGHGKRADVPGYLVGGKTGTAQVPKTDGKGYQDNVNIGSFIGYAPINDPKFVILAKIDDPKNVEWAESSAAPVFGEVMKFLLGYAKIPPTETVK